MRILIPHLLIVLFLIFGCNPQKKAQKDIDNIAVKYPGLIAGKAAIMFPCVPATGDTIRTYVSDSAAYAETIGLLQSQLYDTNLYLDSVLRAVNVDDTGCKRYEVVIAILKNRNADLNFKLQHIPAIHDKVTVTLPPVEDTKKLFLCEEDRRKVIDLLTDKTAEATLYKDKAKTRGIWMWSLVALIVVYSGWKLYGIFKPKA